MPEFLECEVLQKERYINTLNLYLFTYNNYLQYALLISLDKANKLYTKIFIP